MRGLSAKGRAGLRIVSVVLGLGILSGRMAQAEGAEPVTNHQVIILWPGGAPRAKGNDPEQDIPTLTVWLARPEAATGAAVVVCPGGGYGMLASDHEGRQVAEWLNSLGVSAFVLKYQLGPRYHHPAMLQDAGRAIRTVRALGQKWGVDPRRIAILGFSAGEHLASTAGTHFDAGKPDAEDPVERVSSRPDRLILVYPVIALATPYGHSGSTKNLLGDITSATKVRTRRLFLRRPSLASGANRNTFACASGLSTPLHKPEAQAKASPPSASQVRMLVAEVISADHQEGHGLDADRRGRRPQVDAVVP